MVQVEFPWHLGGQFSALQCIRVMFFRSLKCYIQSYTYDGVQLYAIVTVNSSFFICSTSGCISSVGLGGGYLTNMLPVGMMLRLASGML